LIDVKDEAIVNPFSDCDGFRYVGWINDFHDFANAGHMNI